MQTKQFDWNDMNCFQLDVSMWSGRSKLTREDLKDPDAVPPDALASLGSLKLIDPDRLKIFNALKRRALRLLESHGVTFLSGFVVSESVIGTIDGELRGIKAEYEDNVRKLVSDYEEQCDEWLKANSQWAHIIRPRLPSAAAIQCKFSFDWTLFKVQPAGSANHHGKNALDSAKDALGNTAIDEISKMLGECARNLLKEDRTQYGANSFNVVDKAIAKCDELAFINPELGVLSGFLKAMKNSVLTSTLSIDTFKVIFSAVASPSSIRNVIQLHKADVSVYDMAWALQPNVTTAQQPQHIPVTDDGEPLMRTDAEEPVTEHGTVHIDTETYDLGEVAIESCGTFNIHEQLQNIGAQTDRDSVSLTDIVESLPMPRVAETVAEHPAPKVSEPVPVKPQSAIREALSMFDAEPTEETGLMNLEGII